ncbi:MULTISPECIES: 30S ribosomal protein S4 [Haloferax]|uniref:Small ribosomal subunit protein uS4 n=1 Tax=Haloferax prahovense (strain DSM 18310 / JCM 13924 / TL6) TaxID=1227461 RepID=M0G5G6_HALPT|nr:MULTISPECIES: 30S ribosomal protein S4 [Haloferax]ELZ54753.1 30S ribosomal protein S4P [Haloferax sp. ATCC BAA-646]ELZ65865.1 30S ribosomal protein S4P [Haloferax sp. ATCC BAA-644]ELZ66204.1 30S ribosomal protein S4P [Haloferax sp. ATCC BAA-645]ELZ66807.1 30S ribosomal protein S4P [Haloferax prahovense DSM 18310]RDZ47606.1 30S ribosomal protein S4 [Haloferax sp. Atlit-19N]
MTTGNNTKFYETPNHPFQGERIAQESDLLSRYGLKNKEELWRAQSELRNLRREARRLLGEAQGDVEEAESLGAEFMARMRRYGILSAEDDISQTLRLDVTDILERRFQTVAYRKGLAQTPQQARQFIVHGHVTVGGARTTVPSRKVEVDEEDTVAFDETSKLADELHPERAEAQE